MHTELTASSVIGRVSSFVTSPLWQFPSQPRKRSLSMVSVHVEVALVLCSGRLRAISIDRKPRESVTIAWQKLVGERLHPETSVPIRSRIAARAKFQRGRTNQPSIGTSCGDERTAIRTREQLVKVLQAADYRPAGYSNPSGSCIHDMNLPHHRNDLFDRLSRQTSSLLRACLSYTSLAHDASHPRHRKFASSDLLDSSRASVALKVYQ